VLSCCIKCVDTRHSAGELSFRPDHIGVVTVVSVSPVLTYIRLFATKAEKRNKAEDRTHRQRQTDAVVHKTNLQYYPKKLTIVNNIDSRFQNLPTPRCLA